MQRFVTTEQIRTILELDRARDGIGDLVQQFLMNIAATEANSNIGDIRIAQARILWNLGWGIELGYTSFEDFLATVPGLPKWPDEYKTHFDQAILVYAPDKLSLVTACHLTGISVARNVDNVVPYYSFQEKREVYWIYCQSGRRHCRKSAQYCRKSCAKFEIGLSAFEGVSLFAQDRSVLCGKSRGEPLGLPGSTRENHSNQVAYLRIDRDKSPMLFFDQGRHALDDLGSATRGIFVGI